MNFLKIEGMKLLKLCEKINEIERKFLSNFYIGVSNMISEMKFLGKKLPKMRLAQLNLKQEFF